MSRKDENKTSWTELLLFISIILCVYFILSLFDSSITGDGGREWGRYLRSAWGGAVIVILLFWLYVCVAKLLKMRVAKLPRQILGTLQLYISFSFMLGLLKETGFDSSLTLFLPGNFGSGLARFFVLNVGTFITLLLVICSFLLSAFLFGSRLLKFRIPQINFDFREKFSRPRRQRRKRQENYSDYRPEKILFKQQEISREPKQDSIMKIPMPKLKPYDDEITSEENNSPDDPLEIIDGLIARVDAGELDLPKKKSIQIRAKKNRRPLPSVNFPYDDEITFSYDVEDDDDPAFPPPLELFGPRAKFEIDRDAQKDFEKQGRAVVSTLRNFGVNSSIARVMAGPSVIQYQIELAPGTKLNKISGLSDDLAMALAVMSVRIAAPILGTHYAGVEVPNPERKIFPLRNIIDSEEFKNSRARLPLPLGIMPDGKIFIQALEEIQHIIIAGNKGSGKSMFVNACILSLCSVRPPEELRLILIDPRHVEFSMYDGMPHLLSSPVSDAMDALNWAYSEMERRTAEFARVRVRNLATYNRKLPKENRLPEIVIVINELEDIINDVENMLVKLAQKSGAAGIYLLLATHRPSPDVITTMIKANISSRAVFALSSQNDSRNILTINDAEKLTGKGDMLYRGMGYAQPLRLQAGYIDDERISDFVEYMISNLETSEEVKNFSWKE